MKNIFCNAALAFFAAIALSGTSHAQSVDINAARGYERLPLPSEDEILKMLSGYRKSGGITLNSRPTIYRYNLDKIMQILPSKVQALQPKSECSGKDNEVYVAYDPIEKDKRVSFLQSCSGSCVSLIERVASRNSKGFRATKAMSQTVSISRDVCSTVLNGQNSNIVDRTDESVVD